MSYLAGLDIDPALGPTIPKPKPLESRGLLRGLGDVGASFGQGAVTGVRMLTDLAGADNAVSTGLRSVEQYIGDLKSAQAKQDEQEIARIMQEAEGAGVLDQVIAGLRAFATAPISTTAQALGTAVPTIGAALIPGVGAATVAGRAGLLAGRFAPAAVGAAQGVGTVKGSIFDATKQAYLAEGLSEEEATAKAAEAQAYSGVNAPQLALGGALGAVAGGSGLEAATRAMRFGAAGTAPGLLRRVSTGAAMEALPEAAQGGQEKFATNTALANEGFDVNPWAGVVAAGTMEGVAGGLLGGAFGVPKPAPAPEPTPIDAAKKVLQAPTLDAALDEAAKAVSGQAAAPDPMAGLRSELAQMDAADRAEALGLLQTLQRPDVAPAVRAFAQQRLDAIRRAYSDGPAGEAVENEELPVGKATESVASGDALDLTEPIPTPDAAEAIQAGEASKIEPIPAGDVTEVQPQVVLADDLLTGDGVPYGSLTAARVRAKREGLPLENVVEIPGAGWVVRPNMRAQASAAVGAAPIQAQPAGTRGTTAADLGLKPVSEEFLRSAPAPAPAAVAPAAPQPLPTARKGPSGVAKHPATVAGSRVLALVSMNKGGLDPAWISEFSSRKEINRLDRKGRRMIRWRDPLIPGVGRLFRAGGTQDLQELAEMLEDYGYLPPGSVASDANEAGQRAKEIIRAALEGSEPLTQDEELADMQRSREMEEAERAEEALSEPDWFSEFDDRELEASGYTEASPEVQQATAALLAEAEAAGLDTELLAERAALQTEGQSNDVYQQAIQQLAREALAIARQQAGRTEPEGSSAGGADRGAAAEDQGGVPEEAGLTLEAQTPEDLKAKAEREQAAEESARRQRAAEQERLRREAEDRDNRARADATVDDFQLGQSADQQMSGMGDLFAEPATASAPASDLIGFTANEAAQASANAEDLRRKLIDLENQIIGRSGMAPGMLEDALRSRKVPADLKAERDALRQQLRDARKQAARAQPAITPDQAANMRRGDIVRDGSGTEFYAWSARFGRIDVMPLKDGKPVVNNASAIRFALDDATKAANPEYRTDPLYLVRSEPAEAAPAPSTAPAAQLAAAPPDQAPEAQSAAPAATPPRQERAVEPQAQAKPAPKSFRKTHKVKTQVFMEETGTFAEQEIDADTALKALDADISALTEFRKCIAGA